MHVPCLVCHVHVLCLACYLFVSCLTHYRLMHCQARSITCFVLDIARFVTYHICTVLNFNVLYSCSPSIFTLLFSSTYFKRERKNQIENCDFIIKLHLTNSKYHLVSIYMYIYLTFKKKIVKQNKIILCIGSGHTLIVF